MPSELVSVDSDRFAGLRDQARVLRLAWEPQLVVRRDLADWADSWLVRHVSTLELGVLADLSVSAKPSDDVRSLLETIASPCTDLHVLALVGVAARVFRVGRRNEDEIARSLFYLASDCDVLPRELFGFWDEFDLARDGIFGDLAEVRGRFEACLNRYEALADWLELKA